MDLGGGDNSDDGCGFLLLLPPYGPAWYGCGKDHRAATSGDDGNGGGLDALLFLVYIFPSCFG